MFNCALLVSLAVGLVSCGDKGTNNGVYYWVDFSSVIWGGANEEFTVPSTSGYYLLIYDPSKNWVGENYQVKFIQ